MAEDKDRKKSDDNEKTSSQQSTKKPSDLPDNLANEVQKENQKGRDDAKR